MSIKKNLFNFFLIFTSFIIFTFISSIYIDYFGIDRHWSSNFDQELTFTYNALLFNSGIKHEFIDHSAYFTILFLSIFIRIVELFNFIDFYNLRTFLEKNDLDLSLQQIIPFVRIYGGISIALWATTVNLLFYQISNSKVFSFLLTLIIFAMPGTIDHAYQLRTELFSSLFMILSLTMIISYLKREDSKYQTLRLFFFFIFLYSAILNKSQIFFYVPFLILFALFFYKKINYLKLKFLQDLSDKKYLYFFYSIVSFYIILKLIIFKGTFLSLIFILSNIIGLNIVFFYLAKKNSLNPLTYINHFNLIILFSFIIFKGILFIHPSTNEMAFNKTFSNIMGVLQYSVLAIETSNQSTILSTINMIFLNLYSSISKYFLSVNIYSILAILILIGNFLFRNKIGKKYIFFNYICILIPILFTFIGSFRNLASYYHIIWDFFFLIPFCIYIKNLNWKLNTVMVLLLICLTPLNYQYLLNTKINITQNNILYLCKQFSDDKKNNYLTAFQKKIPEEKFIDLCKKKIF